MMFSFIFNFGFITFFKRLLPRTNTATKWKLTLVVEVLRNSTLDFIYHYPGVGQYLNRDISDRFSLLAFNA